MNMNSYDQLEDRTKQNSRVKSIFKNAAIH